MTVWQADLCGCTLHQVNFAYADLAKSIFTKTLSSIYSLAFSPDGKMLVTNDALGNVSLWQVFVDDDQLLTFKGHASWVKTITNSALHEELNYIETLTVGKSEISNLSRDSNCRTTKLDDISSNKCLNSLLELSGGSRTVAFSPEGNILARGCGNGTVKLWNPSTSQCLQTLQGHTGSIKCITFSPQGNILASGSEDQTVKLWDRSTGKCLETLSEFRPYEGMNITGVAGLTSTTIASLKALGAIEVDNPKV